MPRKTAPLTPELRANHRSLSSTSEHFVDFIVEQPAWHRIITDIFDVVPELEPHEVQTWPTFVDREVYDGMGRVAVRIFDLVKSLPERLCGSDPTKVAELWRLPSVEAAEKILQEPVGWSAATARVDFMLGPDGWQALELNVSPSLGGVQLYAIWDLCLEQPTIQEFVAQEVARGGGELEAVQTLVEFQQYLVRDTLDFLQDVGGSGSPRDVNMGWCVPESVDIEAAEENLNHFYAELLETVDPALSGKYVLFTDYAQLEEKDDGLYCRGQRLHMMQCFPSYDLPDVLYRAFKARKLSLYGAPMQNLLSDRRCLCLLSEHASNRELFSAEERAFIQRHVPWTRLVRPGRTRWHGRFARTEKLLLEQRDKLLVKPCLAHGGDGVTAGFARTDRQWQRLIEHALAAPDDATQEMIVQEFVPSKLYLYQVGEQGFAPHRMVWGCFVFGEQPAGPYVRVIPESLHQGVVNVQKGALQSPVVLVG